VLALQLQLGCFLQRFESCRSPTVGGLRVRAAKVLVAATALIVVAVTAPFSAQSGRPAVPGQIIVKFRPGAGANGRSAAHRNGRGTETAGIQRTRVERVRVAAGDEAAAIARYRRDPNVEYAERNYIRRLPVTLADGGPRVIPQDFHFKEQWALQNTGQQFYCIPFPFGGQLCLYGGTSDADIDAPEAWAISKGSAAVTVAVIDTGVDYTHPDLAPNYAGGDDFVFLDGDPMDDHGHGTHVAGTIAAALDNLTGDPATAEGVTGVAPNARILAYKVCRADGTCDDFAIQQAIARAVTDGANVINLSLGESEYSQSLNDAVQDAWNAGLVIVAGAGNDGTTTPFYPAAFDNVISVAAFDEDHLRPSFSNYGTWVDISAPGNAILSTYPLTECGSSATPGDMGCYAFNTGTSMATPHVAGAAALIWSRNDVTSNGLVVEILLNSADGHGASTVRLDSWTIHGGLNLHDAISYGLTNLPPHADAGPDQTVADSNRDGTELVTLNGSASSDSDGTIASYLWREGSTSIGTGETAAVSLSIGTHTLTLEVTDDDGATTTDTVIVRVTPANQISVSAPTAQATEAGPTAGVFTVTRTGDVSAPLTVQYSVGGTAVGGIDYVALSGALTIQAGAATASVVVTPVDDGAFENDESVILTLAADAAYSLGSPATSTVTIVSDDLPPDLVVATMTAPAIGGADSDVVVTDTTKNQGAGPSLPSKTGFYLSTNTTLDAADQWIGERILSSIGAGVSAHAAHPAVDGDRLISDPCKSGLGQHHHRELRDQQPSNQRHPDRPGFGCFRAHRAGDGGCGRRHQRLGHDEEPGWRKCRRIRDALLLVCEPDARCVRPADWQQIGRAARSRRIGQLHRNDHGPDVADGRVVLRDSAGRWRRPGIGNGGNEQHAGERGDQGGTRPHRHDGLRPIQRSSRRDNRGDGYHEEPGCRAGSRIFDGILSVAESHHRPG
jgi:thermitase